MIAIKGMTMPRNCYECWFKDANRCYLNILQRIESVDRPEWCPLVETIEPKHGRWSKEMVCYEDENGYFHFGYQCSQCKAILNKTKRCGECGAIMDEVEE